MKKPALQEVTCPHCQATQNEPEGAISTNCKSCGKYFKLGGKSEARAARAPKTTREVFCVKCGAPNLVSDSALSTQCIRCSHYLELGNKVVKGVQIGKLYAYDDVLFAEGCSFKGMEATGRNMEVRGKVFSKLRATEEIVAMPGSSISGELHALVVRIEHGATVKVQELECARLLVSGAVEITGLLTASEITLSDGAVFSGRLHIPESKLTIGAGATVQFDSITCGARGGHADLTGRARGADRNQRRGIVANEDREACAAGKAEGTGANGRAGNFGRRPGRGGVVRFPRRGAWARGGRRWGREA
jgi:cytoskeletal protein CcmA (bactofilin family)